jgi:hypothetical protein
MKKLIRLIDEVGEVMTSHPDADVLFILRGTYQADSDGEVGVGLGAETTTQFPSPFPESVSAKAEWSRSWDDLGNGEWVLRISRGVDY